MIYIYLRQSYRYEVLEMISSKMRFTLLIGFAGLVALMYISISTILLALLLGLLLVPPVLVFISIIIEGVPMVIKELQSILASEKNFFVISISKESITLEPQFR